MAAKSRQNSFGMRGTYGAFNQDEGETIEMAKSTPYLRVWRALVDRSRCLVSGRVPISANQTFHDDSYLLARS